MSPLNKVENYYDTDPAVEWARLDRHRTEYAVTMKAMQEYLPSSPAEIADIGGGPGRYAIELSKKGYAVTLVDLSLQNINFARMKSKEANIQIKQLVHANALDLETLQTQGYDAALLMGPLYHLTVATERRKAVCEANRILKPGGLIFASFISRYGVFRDGAAKYPLSVYEQREQWQILWQEGINTGSGFTLAYFALPEEIIPLMESEGFETIHLLNVEGIVAEHENEINLLSGSAWEYWVDQNYQFSKDPVLRGCADHLLYVGKKTG